MEKIDTDFLSLINQIQQTRTSQKVKARHIVNAFGFEKRTQRQRRVIDSFFDSVEMEVVPHYGNVWIDAYVEIRPKELATRKVSMDPIRRLRELKAANNEDVACVSPGQSLSVATTIMLQNNFSQLPVTNNGKRSLVGYISWETIGIALSQNIHTNIIKDYMSTDVTPLSEDTPLLTAIQAVYEHDFVVVENETHQVCGIVTTTDISSQYLDSTIPFAMLEEIENHIRTIIEGKILQEQLNEAVQDKSHPICCIDDLCFGDYITLVGKYWDRMGLTSVDKTTFIARLEEIRSIRNDIMHFNPDSVSNEDKTCLINTVRYLRIVGNRVN